MKSYAISSAFSYSVLFTARATRVSVPGEHIVALPACKYRPRANSLRSCSSEMASIVCHGGLSSLGTWGIPQYLRTELVDCVQLLLPERVIGFCSLVLAANISMARAEKRFTFRASANVAKSKGGSVYLIRRDPPAPNCLRAVEMIYEA